MTKIKNAACVCGIILSFFLIGCSSMKTLTLRIDNRQPLPPVSTGLFMAGVADTDITPPPGVAMAGYSAMASRASGFRGRLHARVIYLSSPDGQSIALVQTDLLSGSRLLHHRVAELIADKTDIPARGLMLAGTHTHSAPGNFFGSNFYNTFASSKKGFDPDLYTFLATRIAGAVEQAFAARRPARLATGSTILYDMTRNRSMEAFAANTDVNADATPREAVNPKMFMMRIDLLDDDGGFKPAGAFTSFSIHPTVVPYANELYTADVFGHIARELEFVQGKNNTPWPFVHAAVNGTHGDNSPAYEPGCQGYPEARRLGQAIGLKAIGLFDALADDLTDDVSIMAACREVDLYQQPTIDDTSLCSRPVVGNALTAGAEDGKTPILNWMPFFKEGCLTSRWIFTGSCQGHKRHIGGFFQPIVLHKQNFPHHLFFQAIRINDTMLCPLPFEITCQTGQRIGDMIQETDDSIKTPLVISCANGYFGYATTPEEYSRQHYEGGHTLYGPNTALFLAKHAALLATDLTAEPGDNLPDQWEFSLKAREYFPADCAPEDKRCQVSEPMPLKADPDEEAGWRFKWQDVAPARIDFHRPLVQIETSADGIDWQPLENEGRAVDDSGYDLAVRFCKNLKKRHMGLYEAVWFDPAIPAGHVCRFKVLPRQGQAILYSSVFPEHSSPEKTEE